jgi:hypothetical protein
MRAHLHERRFPVKPVNDSAHADGRRRGRRGIRRRIRGLTKDTRVRPDERDKGIGA